MGSIPSKPCNNPEGPLLQGMEAADWTGIGVCLPPGGARGHIYCCTRLCHQRAASAHRSLLLPRTVQTGGTEREKPGPGQRKRGAHCSACKRSSTRPS
uniref:Putative uncharacterized protein ENSP00000381562 n=1 Tax=Homo sapiens TaxID=9606 RepID=YQ047_HUMAN|nr:RecName: Full=Putative uncharacterized protein ENSP00000381562 [Homo sapiens]